MLNYLFFISIVIDLRVIFIIIFDDNKKQYAINFMT